MARTFGTLYLVGAGVGAVSLIVPTSGSRNDGVLAAVTAVALILSAAFFTVYRRTPMWVFQLATAAGSLIIATATATGSSGAEGGYGVFYVWVVLLAFLFFSFRAAVMQTAFAALTYAVVLIERDTAFAFNFVFGLAAVLGAAGAVVGLLRGRLEQLATNLASQANTDPVTAIANRRAFEDRFDFELMRSEVASSALAVVICDLDRFKAVNDKLGHDEGDIALRLAAASIVAAVRSVDAVSRLGGEEFAVLLPNTETLEAYAVAERIRLGIRDAFSDYPVPLTASCGLACRFPGGLQRKELLRAADRALYEAKRAGRDCTAADPATANPVRAAQQDS